VIQVNRGSLLILDRDAELKKGLVPLFKKNGYEVTELADAGVALALLKTAKFDVICSELDLGETEGEDFVSLLKKDHPETLVIMMSPLAKVETAVDLVRHGAYDFLSKPFSPQDLLVKVRLAQEREKGRRKLISAKDGDAKEHEFSNIVAKSRPMNDIFNTIKKISEYKTTCLLMGESGTGKELIARAIHFNSSRADKPFITVNCGAIPENLLESELFGHVKGAFTGAVRTKKGLFEEATMGTLFLDEIGELPLILQVKLLRALQEEEIRRVGDVNPIKVNSRIIAATVKDLAKEVERGGFREDLYYRLHVLPIFIPPLRERPEDIPLLVEHFIQKYNQKLSAKVEGVEPKVMKRLLDHDWPGNVRELENTIERAMVLATGLQIRFEDLPVNLRQGEVVSTPGLRILPDELSIKKMSRAMEEELILKALGRAGGNRTKAAKLLEISHRALLYKIKRYKIDDSGPDGRGSGVKP